MQIEPNSENLIVKLDQADLDSIQEIISKLNSNQDVTVDKSISESESKHWRASAEKELKLILEYLTKKHAQITATMFIDLANNDQVKSLSLKADNLPIGQLSRPTFKLLITAMSLNQGSENAGIKILDWLENGNLQSPPLIINPPK